VFLGGQWSAGESNGGDYCSGSKIPNQVLPTYGNDTKSTPPYTKKPT